MYYEFLLRDTVKWIIKKNKNNSLWDEDTKEQKIKHAQKYCIDAFFAYQVCINEVELIKQKNSTIK